MDMTKQKTSKTDSKGTTSYLYDTLNRIWVVTEPTKTTTYTYDKSGNRDTDTIVQNGVTTLRKYNYDDNNGLTSINESVGGVAKTSNGKKVRYLYEGNDVILEEDGDGNQTARSVNGVK